MDDAIHVAVVDDHPLFREGVAHSLRTQPGIAVVAEGATAADALAIAADLPDVMLLDVSMPGSGIAALGQITAAYPVVKVIMLTVSEDEEDVTAALRSGARGYVLKGVAARELVSIVRSVAAGEVYVTPSLATSLLVELTSTAGKSAASPLDDLTEREREILELVAGGDSNKEIASRLGLSEKTVKHHMTNILQKLQVRNRVEAALLAKGSQKP
jgi:DNA-binding NarL/FixJ family response regulator